MLNLCKIAMETHNHLRYMEIGHKNLVSYVDQKKDFNPVMNSGKFMQIFKAKTTFWLWHCESEGINLLRWK